MTGFRIRDVTATDPGKLRSVNEDSFIARSAEGLWAVADGMGGHENGQWASRAIIEALEGLKLQEDFDADASAVAAAIHAANAAICAESRAAGARMGSTAVVLLMVERAFAIFWVGDSRAYVLRDGQLHRLTQDHSQVQAMVDAGRLSADEAANHPMSNVLVRAVGVDDELQLDAVRDEALAGDIFLLCSDGLTDVVSDAEIGAELARSPVAAERLVELCLGRGAPDNVTVLTVACEPVTQIVAGPGE
jgi:serine/threonine-protein phosphatase Stp1